MRTAASRTLLVAMAAALALLAGCSSETRIQSDLVLDANGGARLDLHQQTEAINLFNDSDVPVRVKVVARRGRIDSDMVLNAQDRVRLDLLEARAVVFSNTNSDRAVIRWTLRNHDRIQYSMALDP